MHRESTPTRALPCLLAALLLAPSPGCKQDPDEELPPEEPPFDPFADYEPDPELFSTPPDEALLIDVHGKQAAGEQLILLLAADAAQADVDAVIASVDGSLIGQIPDLGVVQIGVPPGDEAALRDRVATAEASPAIEGALLNYLAEFAASPDAEHCVRDDDLEQTTANEQRCPLNDLAYMQFVPILMELSTLITFDDVVIGMIDSGLHVASGQFDDTPILNLDNSAVTPSDSNGHGTQVAGVMIADNGDGGPNGIASRVLDGHVGLAAGGFTTDMMAIATALQRAAADANARVVNFSIGWNWDATESWDAFKANLLFGWLFADNPQTLFVLAAGNENTQINTDNYTPGALNADNVLTVGGTKLCDPDARWQDNASDGSNYGAPVDIAAPADKVPVIDFAPNGGGNPGGPPAYESGTSFATPMVTSAAAVLFAIDDTLTAPQVREYLLEWSFATAPDIGSARLMLTFPFVQAAIDRHSGDAVEKLLDADMEPGWADNPTFIVNRVCGGATLTVEGIGTWTFEPDEEENMGSLNDGGTLAVFHKEDGEVVFNVMLFEPFQLDVPYPMGGGLAEATFMDQDLSSGVTTGGELLFTHCAITERDGIMEWPLGIEISAEAEGTMEMAMPPDYQPDSRSFEAAYTMPLMVMAGDEVNAYLEQNCDGGNGIVDD